MLFQLKLRSQVDASRPLPIKKRRPDLKITLKKLANEPLGARFWALLANWDALPELKTNSAFACDLLGLLSDCTW